jgi:hypothetical protein
MLLKRLGSQLLLVIKRGEFRWLLDLKVARRFPILLICCCIGINILWWLLWWVVGRMLNWLVQVWGGVLPIKGRWITHFPEVSNTKASICGFYFCYLNTLAVSGNLILFSSHGRESPLTCVLDGSPSEWRNDHPWR